MKSRWPSWPSASTRPAGPDHRLETSTASRQRPAVRRGARRPSGRCEDSPRADRRIRARRRPLPPAPAQGGTCGSHPCSSCPPHVRLYRIAEPPHRRRTSVACGYSRRLAPPPSGGQRDRDVSPATVRWPVGSPTIVHLVSHASQVPDRVGRPPPPSSPAVALDKSCSVHFRRGAPSARFRRTDLPTGASAGWERERAARATWVSCSTCVH